MGKGGDGKEGGGRVGRCVQGSDAAELHEEHGGFPEPE